MSFLEYGTGALVLGGVAGIGETTVWLAGVDAARRRGLRSPFDTSAAERDLGYRPDSPVERRIPHDVAWPRDQDH